MANPYLDSQIATKLHLCQSKLEHTFKEHSLRYCLEALNASEKDIYTAALSRKPEKLKNNESLVVYGSNVVRSVLCKEWYSQCWSKDEWTRAVSKLDNTALGASAYKLGLEKCVILGTGTSSVSVDTQVMGHTLQALFGAVHIDGGRKALGKVLRLINDGQPFFQQTQTKLPHVSKPSKLSGALGG